MFQSDWNISSHLSMIQILCLNMLNFVQDEHLVSPGSGTKTRRNTQVHTPQTLTILRGSPHVLWTTPWESTRGTTGLVSTSTSNLLSPLHDNHSQAVTLPPPTFHKEMPGRLVYLLQYYVLLNCLTHCSKCTTIFVVPLFKKKVSLMKILSVVFQHLFPQRPCGFFLLHNFAPCGDF